MIDEKFHNCNKISEIKETFLMYGILFSKLEQKNALYKNYKSLIAKP